MRTTLIGLAVLSLLGCSAGLPPEQPPTETPLPDGPAAKAVMRFRPTWIPDGLHEVQRKLDPNIGVQTRDFRAIPAAQSASRVFFSVSTTGAVIRSMRDAESTQVDINGIPGRMVVPPYLPPSEAVVEWSPEPGERVSIVMRDTPDIAEAALRVARSTVPDSTPLFGGDPIRVGWLPRAKSLDILSVEGTSPDDWSIWQMSTGGIDLRNDGRPCRGENLVEIQVRSTTGWFFHDRSMKQPRSKVFVPLDAGRCLVVSGNNTQDELVRVAESTQLRTIDTAWIGGRK